MILSRQERDFIRNLKNDMKLVALMKGQPTEKFCPKTEQIELLEKIAQEARKKEVR